MNKRDLEKWANLVAKLEQEFAVKERQSIYIFRGDVRAILAVNKELRRAAPPDKET